MRVYVEAYGCAQNLGEAHAIERAVEGSGHPVVADPALADVGVLVTCGVIGSTEARMVRRYRALARRIPRLVVTGCLVPLRAELLDGPERASTVLLPIREQARLPALLADWETDRPRAAPTRSGSAPYGRSVREVVVAQGCTSACSYCFSRLARGRIASVPAEAVTTAVARAAADGAVEVRLSSLDTSAWGADLPGTPSLPDLLRRVADLPGEFSVRVGMMSPQSAGPVAGPLFDVLAGARFFQFLHLPVQSGSDAVLRAMGRGYTVGEFRSLVARARARLPDLTLSTDVIVGFPTEDEPAFAATEALLDEIGPEIVNVTRFSPRPHTPAARLAPLPSGVLKRRSRSLTARRIAVARRRLERWIGWRGTALVTEPGSDGSTLARLPNYLPAVLAERLPLGARVGVCIDGARSTYLLARRERAPGVAF